MQAINGMCWVAGLFLVDSVKQGEVHRLQIWSEISTLHCRIAGKSVSVGSNDLSRPKSTGISSDNDTLYSALWEVVATRRGCSIALSASSKSHP